MRFVSSSLCFLAALALMAPAQAGIAPQRRYDSVPTSSHSVPVPRSPVHVTYDPNPAIGGELARIRERINDARDAGLLTRREARRLKREAGVIGRHAELYGRDGFSQSERDELETRALYLNDAVLRSSTPAAD